MKLIALASILMVSSLGVVAHESPDPDYIAEQFYVASHHGFPFPDIIRINPQLTDEFLYDVQRRYVELRLANGAVIGGFKGGFIPHASVGGVLFQSGIVRGAPTIDRAQFQSLLIEAEIGFRLCEERHRPFTSTAELIAATCEVFPAIELPDAALPDLKALLKDIPHLRRLLIATNMAVSHVLRGAGQKPGAIDLNKLDVRVMHNAQEIGLRSGAESSDDIWSRVLWTINEFVIARHKTMSPDQILIPGALTGLHPGEPGHYRVDYGELGQVEFTVK